MLRKFYSHLTVATAVVQLLERVKTLAGTKNYMKETRKVFAEAAEPVIATVTKGKFEFTPGFLRKSRLGLG